MPRIDKTIFICYRRENVSWALAIYQNLTSQGYDVFFDYLSINTGDFEQVILENINSRAHFIVILTPSALERCDRPDDWLRREIETAIDTKRNIIPLMLESFDFGTPSIAKHLTGKLSLLSQYNGVKVYSEYFFESMNRLCKDYLNIKLSAVLHPASDFANEASNQQKAAADNAAPVEQQVLSAQEWFEKGNNAIDQEDKIFLYKKAIEIDPNYAYAYNNLGNVYKNLGKDEETLANYQKAIEIDPKAVYPYNNLGNVYKDLGKDEEALANYQKAIEIDPKYANAHNGLGNVYYSLKKYEEALAAYQKAINLDPKLAAPHHGLGNIYSDLFEHEKALSAFQKAIDLDPNDAYLQYSLGTVYSDLGKQEEAISAFKKAIDLDPKGASPHYRLGDEYYTLGNHEEALAAYQKAIKLDPSSASPHTGLGRVYQTWGKKEEAISSYQKAIELDPETITHQISLAGYFKKLGQEDKYLHYIKVIRHLIGKEVEYNQACFNAICGNKDEAISLLKIALEKRQVHVVWARSDPDFEFIRDEPQYKILLNLE